MLRFEVGGKVVERVDLLRKKHWAWRFDVWPFVHKRIAQPLVKGVQLTKFHYRLANHLDGDIPKLRCRTTTWTGTFMKMRSMAKRYIAVHLRFVTMDCGKYICFVCF
ncbi:hypothetical protein Tsubulata_033367 [Turnera subulata]|uniref:Uncharacterized protein n=1 Tax=Turnera subulata TaxID=218843 RepID=A0A9Q0J8A9_9ROSI|nr:hypothetical protein Tsubulata_033367 [Turnera subulata]